MMSAIDGIWTDVRQSVRRLRRSGPVPPLASVLRFTDGSTSILPENVRASRSNPPVTISFN